MVTYTYNHSTCTDSTREGQNTPFRKKSINIDILCTQLLQEPTLYRDRLQGPPTGTVYRDRLQGLPTGTSYRDHLQGPPTGTTYRDHLQGPPTRATYRNRLQGPLTETACLLGPLSLSGHVGWSL